ncbi:hypothetical protein PVAP13_1NG099700 [Panicum virgatum]|uniref:Uncharacterized protein n=1 Tax=Panicum virgatum TaxID=38727 RepID=A0A8T0WN74_PANVG|nr:hypothetical protein PVAP13_1NG099700 [Panicum virgatum]
MDAKVMGILLAVFLACLVSPAEFAGAGDNVVRSAGGQRQQWDSSENMNESSSKITLKLCFRYFRCRPLMKTCYCCQTLPKFPCFWAQQECWDACPSSHQSHQPLHTAPAPAPSGRQLQAHSGVTPALPPPAQKFLL